MEEDHTASFISALANLPSVEAPTVEELAGLEGWSVDELKAEIIRLRRSLALRDLRELRDIDPAPTADAILHTHLAFPFVAPVEESRKRPAQDAGPDTEEADGADEEQPRKIRRDEGTGKRVERGRRIELQRALRAKMRLAMNIGADDALPPPSAEGAEGAYWVPNWPAGLGNESNTQWLERICVTFIAEARAYQAWTKVPQGDLDIDIVKAAARTAFLNFTKRYLAEVDPKHAKRREKYIKGRRRWARKDLKQKRRAKAAQDPSFTEELPASALHIDYMSSEYSSAGEDDRDETEALADLRRSHWTEVVRSQTPDSSKAGKGGWADGVSEKVLEVRTPTWRSSRLDEIYRRLDTISSAQAAMRAMPASQQGAPTRTASTKLGHVAPSHRRFTLPREYMRKGRIPKNTGDAWMWASGEVGVWPDTPPLDAGEEGIGLEEVNAAGDPDNLAGVVSEGMDDSVDALVEGWTEVEG